MDKVCCWHIHVDGRGGLKQTSRPGLQPLEASQDHFWKSSQAILLGLQLVSCQSIHMLHLASNIVTPSLCDYVVVPSSCLNNVESN